MNRLIWGLILSTYSFPVFAKPPDLTCLCLGIYNTPNAFYSQYLHSKRTIPDAQNLLREICSIFPAFKTLTASELKEIILTALCESGVSNHDMEKLNQLLDKYSICFACETTPLAEIDWTNNNELPTGVLLGLIEIGCGALLWLTPFRHVGSGLMIDGTRRVFNEIELIDKSRRPSSENPFQS